MANTKQRLTRAVEFVIIENLIIIILVSYSFNHLQKVLQKIYRLRTLPELRRS